MSLITVDLTKEPEVAALLADAKPGKCVFGCFSVKSVDSQTAQLRIDAMANSVDELPAKEEDAAKENEEMEEDDEGADTEQSPEGEEGEPQPVNKPESMGRKIAAKVASGDTMPRF